MITRIFSILLILSYAFTSCSSTGTSRDIAEDTSINEEKWGSFTPDKTYSYDNAYYALQTVENPDDFVREVKVSIYSTDTDEPVADFYAARASDFWGICWESDSYNIWTQSGDTGLACYAYQDGEWVLDREAVRPDDIISKYDK